MTQISLWKIIATLGGAALTGAAVWLNAEHVARAEGWDSPLVLAGVIVTLCAASAPPFAERAAKTGQPFKAVMLWLFFALAVAFSLSASIARSSGHVAGKAASTEASNAQAALAREAYEAAKASAAAECVKRGRKCRELEGKVDEARKALARAAPVQSVDPGAERLAAVLGVSQDKVQLYAPLFLPLGLELGGFIFLALGLAPRRREAICEAIAKPVEGVARRSPIVAKLMRETIATPPKPGTAAYYLARLDRDHAPLAARVRAGEMSVYRACIEAGLRKATAKRKWDANDYVKPESVEA
jgi:hypothetical protein